jgi:hypothetical protein
VSDFCTVAEAGDTGERVGAGEAGPFRSKIRFGSAFERSDDTIA